MAQTGGAIAENFTGVKIGANCWHWLKLFTENSIDLLSGNEIWVKLILSYDVAGDAWRSKNRGLSVGYRKSAIK